ncbi:unnamed protein product [Arabidopsis halleri]
MKTLLVYEAQQEFQPIRNCQAHTHLSEIKANDAALFTSRLSLLRDLPSITSPPLVYQRF